MVGIAKATDAGHKPHRAGGGREQRRQLRSAPRPQLPGLTRNIPIYEILPNEAIELIHEESCRILEEVGIEFRDDDAAQTWRRAGADVNGHRIKIDRHMLMELVSSIPSEFTLHARNPERNVRVGGKHAIFIPSAGSPYVRDLDGVRRNSRLEDTHNFQKLSHVVPEIHSLSSTIAEPMDIPVSRRHLHVFHGSLRWSDKPIMAPNQCNGDRATDTIRMAEIVFGADYIQTHPVLTSVVSCNSPLVWDETMLSGLKVFAEHNQPLLLSPFALAGASTPASTIGAIAQVNAETLAGLAFTQLVRKGSPQVYGQFMVNIDMRTGAPMGGTPEAAHMTIVMAQLARKYNIPFRTSGFHVGAKLPDAQAGYEANMLMHAAILSGAHFIWHVAGWLEAGLVVSFAKFMLDCEQLGAWYKYAQGVDMSDLKEAMAAVREVGPASHYLGTAHTLQRFASAFFIPSLMDFNAFEQWSAEGSKDSATRANESARAALASYEQPKLDEAKQEALRDYIARREKVLPEHVS